MTAHACPQPQPRPEILAIDAYVPGKSRVAGVAKVHKLSSNESPLGPSPKAIEAFRALAASLALYPDGASTALREAIGRRYGLDPARIICGNGSDELLALLAHAFLRPGDEGLYSQYGFLNIRSAFARRAAFRSSPRRRTRRRASMRFSAKVSARTKIVYLANPNNPTGTYIPFSEVKRLQAGLPPHTLLVIDAAYAEYVTRNDYAAGIELASTCENVVMTRTFSKIHGLANLRIGWAYGSPHVLDALNRIRGPFNLNGPAMAAGVASLDDAAHIEGGDRAQLALAALARRGDLGARDRGDAERREFSAADFPKRARPDRRGGGRLLERARLHPARRGGLWAAEFAAADGRRRRGEPGRRRGAGRIHAGRTWLSGSGRRSPSRSSTSWRSSASG